MDLPMMKRRHTTAAEPAQGLPSEVRFLEQESGLLVAQQFLGGMWANIPTIRSSPAEIPKAPETRPAVVEYGKDLRPERNLLLPLIATNVLWLSVFVYGTSVIAREFIALQATVLQMAGKLAEARQTEGSR